MPKRIENKETELERYFWTADNIDKLLGKKTGTARTFKKILIVFKDENEGLETMFKKQPHLVEQTKSKDQTAEKQNTGGRYLFQRCLECRIILNLDEDRKKQLQKNFNRSKLEDFIIGKEKFLDKDLFQGVTDQALQELLEKDCYFRHSAEKEEQEENRQGCMLYHTDKCVPRLLSELFTTYKNCRGKGREVYSFQELEQIREYICRLVPLGITEEEYEHYFDTPEEGKKPNAFSSLQNLQYGISFAMIKGGGWINLWSKSIFRNYYVRQCQDLELVKAFFKKLTRNLKPVLDNQNMERMGWEEKSCENKISLYEQVVKWNKLWSNTIKRYTAYRKEERKQTKKDGIKIEQEVLLYQAQWEFVYEENGSTQGEREIEQIRNQLKKKKEETYKRKGKLQKNLSDYQIGTLKDWQDKACKEVLHIVEQLQKVSERKEIEEKELRFLYIEAFRDLEKVIAIMEIRGKNRKDDAFYRTQMIEITHRQMEPEKRYREESRREKK